jgi:glucosamine--fructose-6-phosphate aminotransferase (isomerizing)
MNAVDSPYLADVLIQVPALQEAVSRFDPEPLEKIANGIKERRFERIILTGMGASFYALYPTWLYLARYDLPVLWVDTAELLHYGRFQITPGSLIWIVSQSGRSAEIVSLLEVLVGIQPAAVLATSNDNSSPLAELIRADPERSILLPINAEPETTVSTRTYLNSLALCQLGARAMCGDELGDAIAELEAAMDEMALYLDQWEEHYEVIASKVENPGHLVLTGRGSSLATVYCGALILGEAGRSPAIGMPAGQFRHGPLEMCEPDLTVMLLAGPRETRQLNQRLAGDIARCGARIFWLGPENPGVPELPMPPVEGIGLPLAEMLPVQLLTVHLARQAGVVPGVFKHIGKVTTEE